MITIYVLDDLDDYRILLRKTLCISTIESSRLYCERIGFVCPTKNSVTAHVNIFRTGQYRNTHNGGNPARNRSGRNNISSADNTIYRLYDYPRHDINRVE